MDFNPEMRLIGQEVGIQLVLCGDDCVGQFERHNGVVEVVEGKEKAEHYQLTLFR